MGKEGVIVGNKGVGRGAGGRREANANFHCLLLNQRTHTHTAKCFLYFIVNLSLSTSCGCQLMLLLLFSLLLSSACVCVCVLEYIFGAYGRQVVFRIVCFVGKEEGEGQRPTFLYKMLGFFPTMFSCCCYQCGCCGYAMGGPF